MSINHLFSTSYNKPFHPAPFFGTGPASPVSCRDWFLGLEPKKRPNPDLDLLAGPSQPESGSWGETSAALLAFWAIPPTENRQFQICGRNNAIRNPVTLLPRIHGPTERQMGLPNPVLETKGIPQTRTPIFRTRFVAPKIDIDLIRISFFAPIHFGVDHKLPIQGPCSTSRPGLSP